MSQAIIDEITRIARKRAETYRTTLNKNVHVADISFPLLKASDSKLDEETYNELLSALETRFYTRNDLEYAVHIVKSPDKSKSQSRFLVEDDPRFPGKVYLVAISYKVLQSEVSQVLKSNKHLSTVFTHTDKDGNTETNIGHIASDYLKNTRSPLSVKIMDALRVLPEALAAPLQLKLKNLYESHELEVSYYFNVSDIVEGKRLQKALGTGTILVTLQSSAKNNALSKEEKAIETEITKYLKSKGLMEALLNQKNSNSVLEDIDALLDGELKGKKLTSIHGKKVRKKSSKLPTSGNYQKTQQPGKLAKLRTLDGRFFSTISLKNILNAQLHDRIKANMGKGKARTVLNYRTGRFARSAQVRNIVRTRDDRIDIFYTYMRRPYATFEPDGRQGVPISRDPKLLIGKSIRQIASALVKQQLRTTRV